MQTLILNNKHQITIPAEVRKALKLRGIANTFYPPGSYEIIPVTSDIRSLKGIVPRLANQSLSKKWTK